MEKATAEEFLSLGHQMMRRQEGGSASISDRRFRGWFGLPAEVAAQAWNLLDPEATMPAGASKLKMLWGLSLLKNYLPEEDMAAKAGVNEKTFRKWAWMFISELSALEGDVVSADASILFVPYFILTLYESTTCKPALISWGPLPHLQTIAA